MNDQDQTKRERQARDIFLRAVEIGSPEARAAYLEGACGQDEALRSRVANLLDNHRQDSFLEGSAVELFPPSEKPGTLIGRYKLLEKIGEGGMGVVYMAQQEEPVHRRVALKVIKLGMDTKQVVARFEAERQALALMDHPNIAKVLDGGATDTGRPYFVMELVRGVPITEFCDRNRFPARERIELFITVCQAIQSAHQKGIIHRDLKPTNILVTLNAGVPMPMVIDFGVAKATQQKLTEKTVFTNYATMIGTPAYMSPEQAEMSRLDVDTRSDIYGLGVLLYELLTGTTPFPEKRLRSASYSELQRIILEEEPERPSTRLSTLQGEQRSLAARNRGDSELALGRVFADDLDWIVMKCLEKDRARRYETANGLAADLKRHLNNEPVVARPPSTAYRLQKALRRNKLAFMAGVAVAAALVVGIGISTWQAVVAQQARREGDHQLYAAKMNLAQQAWDQNNIGRLRQLLEDTQDSPYRGFEWYYWQPKTHLALKTFHGHLSGVKSVALSPDGRRIVTGSLDQTAKVWDAASGRELITLTGHRARICSVAFSPDGQRIVTGSSDGTAKVWEAASGRNLLTLKGHSDPVYSAAFSPDGRRIVTGSYDSTAKVWDASNGWELLTLRGHSSWVLGAAFSPDGRRIVTSSDDSTARVWDAATGKDVFMLTGHSGQICSVAYSPDGQRIATGSVDQTAKVWDAATGKELFMLAGHSGPVTSVAYSPDGQRIATGSWDQTAKIWEASNGRELLTLKGHTHWVWSVAFSPDGQRLVTGSWDQTAKVWEAASGRELFTFRRHSGPVFSAAFSPDGQRIVTGSDDNTAKVWEAASGRELLTLKGHTGGVTSVAFSPDGQRIVTGSGDKTAKVWEAASGRELLTLKGHSDGVWSVAFSADGRRIVTGSQDMTPKVWDAASGRELLSLRGHSSWVLGAAFSPDGRRIVTSSDDNTAKVWEASSGRELLTLRGHSLGIVAVAFSPDGRRIVTGSRDHTARVWEAATAQQVDAWREEERAAAQSIAALERERAAEQERQKSARASDSIKQWLVLAPIALATGQSGAEGLDIEQVEGEARLRPKAGEARSIGGRELKWREVVLTNEVIHFNALLGHETTQSVAYAVCYLRSEAEQRGLQILVGSDGEAKIYLNGKQVYTNAFPRPFYAEDDKVPDIALNAGLNLLVFKVVNELNEWKGSIRLTDAQGNSVKGVQVTLGEGKDLR
jgi:WD40 repeat protein/serine/threonine protein kinase